MCRQTIAHAKSHPLKEERKQQQLHVQNLTWVHECSRQKHTKLKLSSFRTQQCTQFQHICVLSSWGRRTIQFMATLSYVLCSSMFLCTTWYSLFIVHSFIIDASIQATDLSPTGLFFTHLRESRNWIDVKAYRGASFDQNRSIPRVIYSWEKIVFFLFNTGHMLALSDAYSLVAQ